MARLARHREAADAAPQGRPDGHLHDDRHLRHERQSQGRADVALDGSVAGRTIFADDGENITVDLPSTATHKVLKRELIAQGLTAADGQSWIREPRGTAYCAPHP
jgi:hypothetical protein